MKKIFVIFNTLQQSYVSGPNSLTKSPAKAVKYRTYQTAEANCTNGEVVKRLS